MKAKVIRITAIVTLLLFVNFMFSNTVFIHSHTTDDGRTVTHSHPYLPSSHHSHNAQSISLISLLNLTAASAVTTNVAMHIHAPLRYETIVYKYCVAATASYLQCSGLRSPPFMG